MSLYDDEKFFESYAKMPRSAFGLEAAGEWWQMERMLPGDMSGMSVLDIGCGYGWHSGASANTAGARAKCCARAKRCSPRPRCATPTRT